MLVLPTLKTCNCRIVLFQHADLVLETLHCFPFLLVVPILLLGGASKEVVNRKHFYGSIGRVVRQLQQLRRSELFLCLPANDLKGSVGFASEEQALGSLFELGGDRVGHGWGGSSALL